MDATKLADAPAPVDGWVRAGTLEELRAGRVVDGVAWVDPRPRAQSGRAERYLARLQDGLEQDLSLVLVKSVLGLMSEEPAAASRRVLETGALFGARQRAGGWGPGLTILT